MACAVAARASAANVFAVLSSDSGHYRQAYEGFQEEWGSSVPFALAEGEPPGTAPDAVVAFGSRAAQREWPKAALLVTCMAPGARPPHRGETLRISMIPEPALLIASLRKLLPGLGVLRVLWSMESELEDVEEMKAAALEKGVVVLSERVENPAFLPERLRAFSGRADALWLMPDPALVNAQNFAMLREYAEAARTPFLAPTEGLAELGATATLAVSFRELGRAAAAALRTRLRGGPAIGHLHASRLTVTVNEAAALKSGLDVFAASGVDRRIR